MTKKVRWIASLSNGQTLYEERGNFKTIQGELSPWLRLLLYLTENNLAITSIALTFDERTRYNLPSLSKSPKFHAFATAAKPVAFNFFRKMGGDVIDGSIDADTADHFAVIEAQYEGGQVIQVWVDDSNGNTWTLLV
tara:strand:+ start:1929 stop:2339 length:411 start_codon:yes stop_codon:yes gene_type:complete